MKGQVIKTDVAKDVFKSSAIGDWMNSDRYKRKITGPYGPPIQYIPRNENEKDIIISIDALRKFISNCSESG